MPTASHDNNHHSDDLLDATDPIINSGQYGRSRLLPPNRRIRHLHGLSLRNLRIPAASNKSKNDRVASNSSLLARQASAESHAARDDPNAKRKYQSNDPPVSVLPSQPEEQGTMSNGDPQKRPPISNTIKRRSTMIWAGKSPEARQRKLEDVIGNSMADTWFSLHCGVNEEPVYVSEVVPEAMNPNYRYFDLDAAGPSISRLDELAIKVWAKTKSMVDYELLIEQEAKLPSLQYLGKSLEDLHYQLSHNCIVFYLTDGVYTIHKSATPYQSSTPLFSEHSKLINDDITPTSSYDALMRLSTLDECIQDALLTRQKLTLRINNILTEHKEHMNIKNQVLETKGSLASLRRSLGAAQKQLKLTKRTHTSLADSLKARREAISQGRQAHRRAQEYLDGAGLKLKNCEALIHKCSEDLRGQRRRICEDLSRIYPIEPIPNQPLKFTIRSLPLPNSTFSSSSSSSSTTDEDTVSAALGYVSHLVALLSTYLSLPLPYPVHPQLSTSVIHDVISQMQGSRIFPLYGKGTVQYRFEYGVFLLNKDIEFLLARHGGVKVLDLRHTLPNLKYLLYLLTSDGCRGGEDDVRPLPGRKKGGRVRGLLLLMDGGGKGKGGEHDDERDDHALKGRGSFRR